MEMGLNLKLIDEIKGAFYYLDIPHKIWISITQVIFMHFVNKFVDFEVFWMVFIFFFVQVKTAAHWYISMA